MNCRDRFKKTEEETVSTQTAILALVTIECRLTLISTLNDERLYFTHAQEHKGKAVYDRKAAEMKSPKNAVDSTEVWGDRVVLLVDGGGSGVGGGGQQGEFNKKAALTETQGLELVLGVGERCTVTRAIQRPGSGHLRGTDGGETSIIVPRG